MYFYLIQSVLRLTFTCSDAVLSLNLSLPLEKLGNKLPSLKKESKGELDIFVLQLRYHESQAVD